MNIHQKLSIMPMRFVAVCILCLIFATCSVRYSLQDVSVPPEIKTARIFYIENRARYIYPQLSPALTAALQQKIAVQTKLTVTNSDDAHYQISGYVSNYSVSTTAIATQAGATGNQLTVGVHIILKNTLDNKTTEFDATRSFTFSATLSLQQAEVQLQSDIIDNITNEIFNHIFSNW